MYEPKFLTRQLTQWNTTLLRKKGNPNKINMHFFKAQFSYY